MLVSFIMNAGEFVATLPPTLSGNSDKTRDIQPLNKLVFIDTASVAQSSRPSGRSSDWLVGNLFAVANQSVASMDELLQEPRI
jgi:hypothetical protein